MVPLAHSALADARYSTAAAISAGSRPGRTGSAADLLTARPRSGYRGHVVSTKPGATVVTEIPYGASPRDQLSNAFRPALLAPYAGWPGSPQKRPERRR